MRRLTSVALTIASRWAACSNARTEDRYETNVTAESGTTDNRRKAMMRRALSDMAAGPTASV
jgi:hypothetical protein